MKKKIAFITSASGNVGDLVHAKGLEYILHQVFPKDEYSYHRMIQWRNYYNYDFWRTDYDYILLGGSPCLSPRFYEYYKYGVEIRRFFKWNKQAIKVLCGGGSNFSEDYTIEDVYKDKEFASEVRKFYGDFDSLITRDHFAENVFKEAGLSAHCLPCPSMFIFKQYKNVKLKEKRELPLIIFGNPNAINPGLTTDKRKQEIIELQRNLAQRIKGFRPMAISSRDVSVFSEKTLTMAHVGKVKIIKNSVIDLFDMMMRAEYVISARVHSAIPASLLGLMTYLIPFDTRKYCAEFFNIKTIYKAEDVKSYPFKEVNIDEYERQYIKLLEGVR